MTNHIININCGTPVPNTTTVVSGDKVIFVNTMEDKVRISFNNADTFDPERTKSLSIKSAKSKKLKISDKKRGTDYSYADCTPVFSTRSGRIDV